MKVNNISTYNSNPQFKALRLRQGSEEYISTMPDTLLNKLDNVGEYLANTKFYNLDITKDGFFIHCYNGEKLHPPFILYKSGQVLIIEAKQCLSQVIKKLKYKTSQEISDIEEKIKKSPTQLERTAEIVKILDNYEKRFANIEDYLVIDSKESRDEKIKKLMKKYKYKSNGG